MARVTAKQPHTKPGWLTGTDIRSPARLRERLGADAPLQLTVLGNSPYWRCPAIIQCFVLDVDDPIEIEQQYQKPVDHWEMFL